MPLELPGSAPGGLGSLPQSLGKGLGEKPCAEQTLLEPAAGQAAAEAELTRSSVSWCHHVEVAQPCAVCQGRHPARAPRPPALLLPLMPAQEVLIPALL